MFERLTGLNLWRRFARRMLDLDAIITAGLYESGRESREFYTRFATFMDKFHVGGVKKLMLEGACELVTLTAFGSVFLLVLANPAFQLTQGNWQKKQDLAVTFLDRYGHEVGRRGIRHDDSVPLSEYPPNLIHAVVSTEDRRFYDHFGVDVIGTLRALVVDFSGKKHVQGGSTLTQQLAKNLFLTNQRTIERKVNEAFLAVWLENHLSKRQIIKMYLDRNYMGGGTFGAQAAAQYYFGKSIRDLNLSECAMLAGLFKAPTKFSPDVNLPAARARADVVLSNMVKSGYISEGQMYAARRNPATPVAHAAVTPPDWYLDWAFDEVKKLADAGKFGNSRVLTVRTALDTGLQKFAEASIQDHLREFGHPLHISQSAAVFARPDGAVRAMIGGRDYGVSQFNRATDAMRQPGSSFKPYVYLTALLTGRYRPNSIVVDGPVCLGDWCPKNYERNYLGPVPLWKALAESINTVAVKLSILIGEDLRSNSWKDAKLGRKRIIATTHMLGITSPLEDTPSLPIGSDAVKLIDVASAYDVFANGGFKAPAYAVVSVMNSRGEVIYDHDRDGPKPVRIVNPNNIVDLDYMMMKVVETGTGRRAQLGFTKVAGKTGTTNSYRDAWFNGFTGNYVGIVWYGNDDDSPMNKVVGGSISASTWHDVMVYAHHGVKLVPLPGAQAVDPASVAASATTSAGNGTLDTLDTTSRPASLSLSTSKALGGLELLLKKAGTRQESLLSHSRRAERNVQHYLQTSSRGTVAPRLFVR